MAAAATSLFIPSADVDDNATVSGGNDALYAESVSGGTGDDDDILADFDLSVAALIAAVLKPPPLPLSLQPTLLQFSVVKDADAVSLDTEL